MTEPNVERERATDPPPTLWGIYLISAVYGLAAALMVWLYLHGTGTGRTFALICGPICAVICVGIGLRVNAIRVALICLLCVAVVGDALFFAYSLAGVVGAVQFPDNVNPIESVLKILKRLPLTVAMVVYLYRPVVREAFVGRSDV